MNMNDMNEQENLYYIFVVMFICYNKISMHA